MNPMNVVFLAVALSSALVAAAPQPTFRLIENLFEDKKEKKEEKKNKDNDEPTYLYVKPASYETYNTYQQPAYGHGYGAPIPVHHSGQFAPIDSYGAPAYPILTDRDPTRHYGY